jgi:hypothetical protein
MRNILFLYDNLADGATLAASSEASGFPVENIQHPFRTKVFRTAGATPGTANVVFDFGAAVNINCVALADYNWTSAPGTLDLEFNATDVWTSPAATEALTWAANPTANGNRACIGKTFATKNYRYARLNVVYSTGDWDLGRIFLGAYFEPDRHYRYEGYSLEFIDPSYISQAVGGQKHVDEIEAYRAVKMAFNITTQAQLELFQKLWNNVGRRSNLFIAFDYDSEPNEMTMYGSFVESMPTAWQSKNRYPITLQFQEAR